MPGAVHKRGSADERLMDDNHLPNDGWTIYDPVFHDRLNHTMDHRSLQDGLYDLSLDHAAFNRDERCAAQGSAARRGARRNRPPS